MPRCVPPPHTHVYIHAYANIQLVEPCIDTIGLALPFLPPKSSPPLTHTHVYIYRYNWSSPPIPPARIKPPSHTRVHTWICIDTIGREPSHSSRPNRSPPSHTHTCIYIDTIGRAPPIPPAQIKPPSHTHTCICRDTIGRAPRIPPAQIEAHPQQSLGEEETSTSHFEMSAL